MRAELRSLHSPDAGGNPLQAFKPEDAEHFGILVQALIGPSGDRGEESFDLTVCTTSWLARQPLTNGYEFVRSTLLLERWDAGLVQRAISDLCRNTEGETWSEIAHKLSRFGSWEFEEYDAS